MRDITDCPACNGSGLLMDDEEWKYPCSVCGGDGTMTKQQLENYAALRTGEVAPHDESMKMGPTNNASFPE